MNDFELELALNSLRDRKANLKGLFGANERKATSEEVMSGSAKSDALKINPMTAKSTRIRPKSATTKTMRSAAPEHFNVSASLDMSPLRGSIRPKSSVISFTGNVPVTNKKRITMCRDNFAIHKVNQEIRSLESDVLIFHEAKLMQSQNEDLLSDANAYCQILKEPISFAFATKHKGYGDDLRIQEYESSTAAFWSKIRYSLTDRREDSIDSLQRDVPVGTLKMMQNMKVQVFSTEKYDAVPIRVLTMRQFLREHDALKHGVRRQMSRQPRHASGDDLFNSSSSRGNRGTSPHDETAEESGNKKSQIENIQNVDIPSRGAGTHTDSGVEQKDVVLESMHSGRISRNQLEAKLKSLIERCVDETKTIDNQIHDIALRGWNVL